MGLIPSFMGLNAIRSQKLSEIEVFKNSIFNYQK